MGKILKTIFIIFGLLMLMVILLPSSDQPAEKQTSPADQIQQNTQEDNKQVSESMNEAATNDEAEGTLSDKQYALAEETAAEQSASADSLQKGNLTIHFIDVGQGDSILLECDGKNMLIDAGEKDMGTTVSAYLRKQGISAIDYVVATHPHSDHIGGLLTILDEYPVGQFIDSGSAHTSQTYEDLLTKISTKKIPVHEAQRGENIDFASGIQVQVLNPGTELSEDLNENSVVLKVTDNDVSFLLMGDAGLETEASIMSEGYDLDADILKVGHHGSTSASGQSFISAVSPAISIIEVGSDNDYGHPHAEVLERLQSASAVYRTDQYSTITITTDGSAYTMTTEKTSATKTSTSSSATSTDTTKSATSTTSEPASSQDTMEESASDADKNEGIAETPVQTSTSDVHISDLNLDLEWVKIENSGSSSVDLTGWQIKDEDNKHTYTFPSFHLDAGATVTLYTDEGTNTENELYWGSGSSFWNNDGDTASLYDSEGSLISSLER